MQLTKDANLQGAAKTTQCLHSVLVIALTTLLLICPGNHVCAQTVPEWDGSTAVAYVDPKALQLLSQVKSRLHTIRTLSAVCTHTLHYSSSPSHTSVLVRSVRVRLMRPNFTRIDSAWQYQKTGETVWHKVPHYRTDASDGHSEWTVYTGQQEFDRRKAAADGHGLSFLDLLPLDGFFDPEDFVLTRILLLRQEGLLRSLKLGAIIHSKGAAYRLIRLVYQRVGSQVVETEDYWIGSDLLIHRIHSSSSTHDREDTKELSHLRVDAPMTRASFAFTTPAGAQPRRNVSEKVLPPLLAKGAVAPDFTVQDAQGNPLRLADLRGKWVILDFWATWCGPCVQLFPGLNTAARQYKEKNVVALAVSVGDTPQVLQAWMPRHKEFDAIRFGIDPAGINGKGVDKLYKVGALPTQFLIDPSGKIRASYVGYDNNSEKRLNEAIMSAVSAPEARSQPALSP